jgi:hypothetical protein
LTICTGSLSARCPYVRSCSRAKRPTFRVAQGRDRQQEQSPLRDQHDRLVGVRRQIVRHRRDEQAIKKAQHLVPTRYPRLRARHLATAECTEGCPRVVHEPFKGPGV